jgi:hypothetical protein
MRKNASLILIGLLLAALIALKVRADHKIEQRARQVASTLHRTLDITHNNFRVTLAVYRENHASICVEYTDIDDANRMYSGRALLRDGDSKFSYSLDEDDDLWIKNCQAIDDNNLLDLTEKILPEDR